MNHPNTLFICSAGHSGSTLLDLMLGGHSNVTSLGEIRHLPKNFALNTACTCGAAVRECTFWAPVAGELGRELGIPFPQQPYALDLGFIDASIVKDESQQTKANTLFRKVCFALRYYELRTGLPCGALSNHVLFRAIRNKQALFSVVSRQTKATTVVDSSKHYLEAVNMHSLYPRTTHIVLLVRDGRAVFYSNLKRDFGEQASLAAWHNTYSRALPLLRKLPKEKIVRVKYEDLVQQPETTLTKVCTLLGEQFEAGMLSMDGKDVHITNGNNMRFRKDKSLKLDTSWREGLSSEQLAYFEQHAGSLNRSLGYD